ncbi:DNA-binding response regulator [Leptolyngbya iicbica LK]|uniref:DNA-binding response regulator n=3 Tax=Cyanophyceae TaxID=3028117 RepID=A0A4Q7EI81_9CYAN|nr:response regulator transcription factor [Leptolyngbya sp. LK]RZM83105.1 DNA-binding response regulator [Leptolyngbya sp. LK]
MNDIRIIIIEDHDLTRMGLKAALKQHSGITVIGEAATGQEGLRLLNQLQPDVAIVDIGLPDLDGVEVTRKFKDAEDPSQSAATKVLMLTMHDTEESVMAAFAAGADSYSVKDVDIKQLVEAIRLTHEGQVWIDPAIARIVLSQAKRMAPIAATGDITQAGDDYTQVLESAPLTERELEVLELIVAGYSNAKIAEELYITVGTVKTHVCNILNKLSASDRTQAAVRALRTGLVR